MPPDPAHLPDTLTPAPITPTRITPGPGADLEPARADSMVWVPGPAGGFIAVPKAALPEGYLHTLTPIPTPAPPPPAFRAGVDPRAQILAAGGIGAGAAGWGAAQLVSAVAGLGTAGLLALALLAVAARMPRPGTITGHDNAGHGAGDHTEIHIHKGGKVRTRNLNIR